MARQCRCHAPRRIGAAPVVSSWIGGAAQLPFRVSAGTRLAGYADRNGMTSGVLDQLAIGALFLTYGEDRFVLVSADVVAVDSALVDEVATAAGLERSELALCASHTHSGPAGVVGRLHPADPDELLPELRKRFVQTCKNAIALARERAEPVELRFAQGESHAVAANRNDPAGPFDPRVSVLATQNPRGYLTAVLAHFACHPTILSAGNHMLSADFPGAMRKWTGQALDQNRMPPVVLYANGAAGDISTRFTRRAQDHEEVTRIGREIGVAAFKALFETVDVGPGIATASTTVRLEPRALDGTPLPEPTDASAALTEGERRRIETRAQGARMLERLAHVDPAMIPSTVEIRVWRLGGLYLIAIPGELFASLGARIVEAAPGPTLVLGYTNGYAGYLSDAAAYEIGSYEALASPFAANAGEEVVRAATAVIGQLESAGGSG